MKMKVKCLVVIVIGILWLSFEAFAQNCQGLDSTEQQFLSYFQLSPVARLNRTDSIINCHGSSLAVSFAINDIQALTGDTTRISPYYSSSGTTGKITHATTTKINKIFKRWRKTLKKRDFGKNTATFVKVDYYEGMSTYDSLSFFLVNYVHLPILSRMEYLANNIDTLPVSIGIILCVDINSILNCDCTPYTCVNGTYVVDQGLLRMCKNCWDESLNQ